MALPPELATANVYGTYVNLDGGPTVGYLIFQPSPVILKATASREFIVPTTMQVNLDETGHFTIVLPACDDPDVTPSDWTYQVTEAFGARRVYSIEVHVANGTDQNIYDLAPVALANGTYYLQGDRGPAGPDVLTTTGKPAPTVGDDGDKAFDLAAGVVYVRTGTTWDNGTPMGTSSPTGGSLVRRDANGRVQAADPAANSDGATKGYVDTADAATLASAKSYADTKDTAAKVGPTFTGPVQVTGNQTVTGSQVVSVDQTVGGKLTVSGQTSLGAATVSGTPTNAADVVRKDYVDSTAGTNVGTPSALVRRDSSGYAAFGGVQVANTPTNANEATRKDYVDTADNLRVQIGGDLGGTVTAPQVTSGTHHTHTSAQISDATVNATPSTVASRDANGDSTFHAAWVNTAPTNVAHATRKDYVDTQDAAMRRPTLNQQTGATYTLVLTDERKIVYCTSATAVTVTVPTNATAAFPVGTVIDVLQGSTGTVTIAGAGVTLWSTDGSLSTRARNSMLRLTKTFTDTWEVSGDNNSATDQAVTAATASPTANKLALRDASGGLSLAYLDHSYAAAPASPTSGNGRLYLDSTYHTLSQVSSDGTVRYQQVYWGGVTAFPVSPYLKAGDTCYRTDIGVNGTVFQYSGVGTNWVPETYPMLARLERTTSTPAYTAETVVTFDTGSGTFVLAQQTRVQFTLRGKNAVSISGNVARNQIYVVTGSTYPASVPAATRLTALFDKYIGNTLYGETISFEADVLLPAGTYTMALTLYGASGGCAAALNYEASSGPGLMPLSSTVLKAFAIGTS